MKKTLLLLTLITITSINMLGTGRTLTITNTEQSTVIKKDVLNGWGWVQVVIPAIPKPLSIFRNDSLNFFLSPAALPSTQTSSLKNIPTKGFSINFNYGTVKKFTYTVPEGKDGDTICLEVNMQGVNVCAGIISF